VRIDFCHIDCGVLCDRPALGIINGIFEALPMIGPVLGMVPALLIALATSPEKAIWVLVAGTLIQQVENNLLAPRVMDKSVGINPIVSILAIAAFTLLFGLVGAIFAIPLVAMLQILLARALAKSSSLAEELPATPANQAPARGKLEVLRLEVRELAGDVRKQARAKDADESSDLSSTEQLEDAIEMVARELDELLARSEDDRPAPALGAAQSPTFAGGLS
jgi:Na+/phosphate symporter